MNLFLIAYDLNTPGQDYNDLITKIKRLSGGTWAHVLESTWIIRSNSTASQIRNTLQLQMDANDEILVIDITSDAAAWSLNTVVSDWLLKQLS